jgi:hypothetical protein
MRKVRFAVAVTVATMLAAALSAGVAEAYSARTVLRPGENCEGSEHCWLFNDCNQCCLFLGHNGGVCPWGSGGACVCIE